MQHDDHDLSSVEDEKELLKSLNISDDESDGDADVFKEGHPKVLLDKKKEKELSTKTKKLNVQQSKPGVIYLGRIPHGFYEDEMKSYFSQFGTVTRLRLSRNKKTGKSKHYAFIEFENEQVANIVAETMDNYLLFNHMLKCKVIPADQVHPDLFKGANKKFHALPTNKIHRQKHNAKKTPEQKAKNLDKLVMKEEQKRKRLQELGIDYEFEGYKEARTKKAKIEQDLASPVKTAPKSAPKSANKKAAKPAEKVETVKPAPKSPVKAAPKSAQKEEKKTAPKSAEKKVAPKPAEKKTAKSVEKEEERAEESKPKRGAKDTPAKEAAKKEEPVDDTPAKKPVKKETPKRGAKNTPKVEEPVNEQVEEPVRSQPKRGARKAKEPAPTPKKPESAKKSETVKKQESAKKEVQKPESAKKEVKKDVKKDTVEPKRASKRTASKVEEQESEEAPTKKSPAPKKTPEAPVRKSPRKSASQPDEAERPQKKAKADTRSKRKTK
ncbi:hypothetical protein EDD86DRAFT_275468 [Gorgonomyces haynaldii]|nr:hypothetical protein EDD86DRAFT_275468 [Gorgonomyces haynaldii]